MERGGQSLVQRDLIRNQESEIGVEVLSCNILVFVDIEKPSISFGLYDQDGMHARMQCIYRYNN